MTDAEWMPDGLSALLGMQPDDPQSSTNVSMATAMEHLCATRAISERRAHLIVENGRCDECRCVIGKEVDQDECLCPCHCDCCCPPLFHCVTTCECKCDCHCDPNSSSDEGEDDEETDVEAAQRTPASPSTDETQFAGKPEEIVAETPSSIAVSAEAERSIIASSTDEEMKTAEGAAAQQSHNENGYADGDDAMTGTAPTRQALDKLHTGQLTVLLVKFLTRDDEQAEINSRAVAREIFTQEYTLVKPIEQASTDERPTSTDKSQKPKKANAHLPALLPVEEDRLYELLRALVIDLKQTSARVTSALKDIAVAAARSTWTLTNILEQRLRSAKTPRAPPVNVWTRTDSTAAFVDRHHGVDVFRFDPEVYSPEEMHKLRSICHQEHVFAATTRAPSADEWAVMMGMMSGAIIAGALPQFLKRCCTLLQIVWLHEEIRTRAEGEVWVQLPTLAKMYNYNQSTRRLVEALRQGAAHQKWTDTRFETMLNTVKSIAYNKALHSIHFFFYTKREAAQWEGMPIPFRASKLVLRNPDTKLRRSENTVGLPTDDDDGLVNDRYQAQHQTRLINVPRTLDLAAVIAFLQDLTGNGLKSGTPLDTYGPHAEGSLMWDLFANTETCPTQLQDIHRVDWMGHLILLQHRPETGPQPCFQCARVGHQTAACPTPEAEWNTTTITVTAAEAAKFTKRHLPWKSLDDVQRIFDSLNPPVPVQTKEDQATAAPGGKDSAKTGTEIGDATANQLAGNGESNIDPGIAGTRQDGTDNTSDQSTSNATPEVNQCGHKEKANMESTKTPTQNEENQGSMNQNSDKQKNQTSGSQKKPAAKSTPNDLTKQNASTPQAAPSTAPAAAEQAKPGTGSTGKAAKPAQ